MTLKELRAVIKTPYFFWYQLERLFPGEKKESMRVQLARLAEKGEVVRLKKGLYIFADAQIDNLSLSGLIYRPSYVSLETALNLYGLMPDIPLQVTAVTTKSPRKFDSPRGVYIYSLVERKLFFGYEKHIDNSGVSYDLAFAEKALLDWLYIRRVSDLTDYRIERSSLDTEKLQQFSQSFPDWVRKALKYE